LSVLATGGADSISFARLCWTRIGLAEAAKDSLRRDGHCTDGWRNSKGEGETGFWRRQL